MQHVLARVKAAVGRSKRLRRRGTHLHHARVRRTDCSRHRDTEVQLEGEVCISEQNVGLPVG